MKNLSFAIALSIAIVCSCQKPEKPIIPDEDPIEEQDPEKDPDPEPEPDPTPEPSATVPDMVEIPAGTFTMGNNSASGEDIDESPAHSVTFSESFRMSSCEITNKLYEEYDPTHERVRGFSKKDNTAVVNVTYDDAVGYCNWLSMKTGRNFRLPTEAEWEYACRAGTTTDYYTGNSLPSNMQKSQNTSRDLQTVVLTVGETTPNSWGLYDMHGNVEEWCLDWYAPYSSTAQTDPAGPTTGEFRVTRGGSHNTPVRYLRSSNRLAATPDDSHVQIGFRIVESSVIPQNYEAEVTAPRNMAHVNQNDYWSNISSESVAFWKEPIPFVIEPDDNTLFYSHNHQPAVTWCKNGDLLAIWYSCKEENGREMTVVASRLRAGANEWEPASDFFKVPDRNMTGSSLVTLDDGTLIHMNGVANSGDWQNLALCARRSSDNGATWSAPILVEPLHEVGHQVISGAIVLKDGTIVQLCDAGADGNAGSAMHISKDKGITWECLWDGSTASRTDWSQSGSVIAGIHAGIVELNDGTLMCYGRGNNIDNMMPCSISKDNGKTWSYSATQFAPIGSGQRHVLIRLIEGPIMLASFDTKGLFVSISEDEGKTWSKEKLMTDGVTRNLNGGAHTGNFTMTADQAEPKGYFACTQTPDGTIHLLSSRLHYRFNLAWLKE